ncbi:Linearmycin resistance ATP-binding protein LnrL [subsurface metagenome]|nr:ATP-binding cassette domain-containing protein [Dehalococcoidia bacterium]
MAEAVITLDNVTKILAGRQILKNISFAVEVGDIFGYLGPNGAGKTTTIRVILGLFPPNSGTAFILGKDVKYDDAREKVGFVLEADGLYDNMTAYENLDYYCQIYGMPSALKSKRIDEMLDLVELSDRAGDKVSSYSKGMRQKLALARSMVHEPDLLIFDEPTAGVDPTGQMEVRQILLNLAQRGKTIFLSSHNLDEVQRICNRIALIDQGEIKLYDELGKLRRDMGRREVIIETGITTTEEARLLDGLVAELEALPYVTSCRREAQKLRLQLDGRGDISEIVAMLSQKSIGVEEVRKGEISLEEIYAKVTKGRE